jgi:hypothetical protein
VTGTSENRRAAGRWKGEWKTTESSRRWQRWLEESLLKRSEASKTTGSDKMAGVVGKWQVPLEGAEDDGWWKVALEDSRSHLKMTGSAVTARPLEGGRVSGRRQVLAEDGRTR